MRPSNLRASNRSSLGAPNPSGILRLREPISGTLKYRGDLGGIWGSQELGPNKDWGGGGGFGVNWLETKISHDHEKMMLPL